jgi:hypothetical protein
MAILSNKPITNANNSWPPLAVTQSTATFATTKGRGGISFDRLMRQIHKQSKMKCRMLHEKHLEELYQDTILAMDGYMYILSNPSNLFTTFLGFIILLFQF